MTIPGISQLAESDEQDVRRLLHVRSMHGALQLAVTRDPDYRRSLGAEGGRHDAFVMRDARGELIGMGAHTVFDAYFNGGSQRLGYLGQLRVDPGRCGPRRLRDAFQMLREARRADELPFDISCILAGNLPAIRLLERGIRGLPRYHRLRRLQTLLIPTRLARGGRGGFAGMAREDQRAAIVECLHCFRHPHDFAPVWAPDDVDSSLGRSELDCEDFVVHEQQGEVLGCAAVWDQRGFKQVRIQGYAPWLRVSRPLVNVALRLRRRPLLPQAPSTLPLGYLAYLACPSDDVGRLTSVVDAALRRGREKQLEYLAVTFAEDHPLLAVLRRAYPAYRLSSWLCVIDWGDDQGAVQRALASRTPWTEAALL